MSAERATYVDSSALVKLAVREAESAALRRYLARHRPLVSSALVRTEVVRALLSPSVTASDEERIAKFIAILFEYPFLPAFKAIVAAQTADPGWRAVRPPWVELPENAQRPLLAALESAAMRVSPARAV